jgi:hypothetical protein
VEFHVNVSSIVVLEVRQSICHWFLRITIIADDACKNISSGRIKSTAFAELTGEMCSKSVSAGLWELFMVNFGKAVSIYITTDDDLCALFIKKFIGLSNLSNIHSELRVGVCIQVKHIC